MNAFLHAVAFLTRIPVPAPAYSAEEWQKSAAYYPLVGALLGVMLWLGATFTHFLFPPAISAVLTILLWIYLTGGLHLDGWMDVADGLGSNRSREKMLEIMKDSRVGAMGTIAAIMLIMVKAAAVYELSANAVPLLVPPLIGRCMLVFSIWFFPYLTNSGLGEGLRNGLSKTKLLVNAFFSLGLAILLFKAAGLLICIGSLVAAWLLSRYLYRKLGGLTGDCYGAIVEGTEAASLLLILLAGRLGI